MLSGWTHTRPPLGSKASFDFQCLLVGFRANCRITEGMRVVSFATSRAPRKPSSLALTRTLHTFGRRLLAGAAEFGLRTKAGSH